MTSQQCTLLTLVQGKHFIVQGLEDCLYNKAMGESFTVSIPPEKAYGLRNETLIQKLPLDMLDGIEVEIGMTFRATTEGEHSVIVVDMDDESIIVDGNHPLAGHILTFDITIKEVRDATEKDLSHGLGCKTGCC